MGGKRGVGAWSAVALSVTIASVTGPADALPLQGCYERVYESAYLAVHPGQSVVRATLSVQAAPATAQTSEVAPIIAEADLKLWIRGIDRSFDSLGACWAEGAALHCGGALSAAEADQCKNRQDGVRQCRIDLNDAGDFRIEAKPEGVLVAIVKRLELLRAPYDVGPYLYLSPSNPENHAFFLKVAPASRHCR